MSTIKEDLVRLATQKVQNSGINSLTIRELGESVGIKSSSVMYHVKSKDFLLQEMIKSYSDGFVLYLETLNKENHDKAIRLDKFVDIFESELRNDKFCLAGMFASENKILDDATAKITSDFFEYAKNWIAQNLKDELNTMQMSSVIITSLEGAMMLDKLNGTTKYLSAVRVWIKSLN